MSEVYQTLYANVRPGATEYMKKNDLWITIPDLDYITDIDDLTHLEISGKIKNNMASVVINDLGVSVPLEFLEIFNPLTLSRKNHLNSRLAFVVKVISDNMDFESIKPIFITIQSDDFNDVVCFLNYFNKNLKISNQKPFDNKTIPPNIESTEIMNLFHVRDRLQTQCGKINHPVLTIESISYFDENHIEYDVDNFQPFFKN
jgi:hypothetical protein